MKRIVDLSFGEKNYQENKFSEEKDEDNSPKKSKFRTFLKWFAIAVLIAAVWQIFIYFNRNFLSNFPEINEDRYQVVFLRNNLVYFGKLTNLNRAYVVMKGAYYFKSQDDKNGLNLIKLTNEIHHPEEELYVPKSEILFWENLAQDSPVVRIITQENK